MISLFFISIAIISIYILLTINHLKTIPTSISETYYRIETKWLFSIVMFLSGFTLMPVMLELSSEMNQFLAFLGCAGVLFVGASPHFLDKFEGKIHAVAASVLLLASQLWILTTIPYMLFTWFLLIFFVYLEDKKVKLKKYSSIRDFLVKHKFLFYVEVIAIYSTYITIFIKLLQ